jgi:hypothetical protein
MSFTDFWKQTYARLRDLDPGAKIIGPSIASYDGNYLKNFLSFAKSNDCLPDIVSWHELSGANITGNFQSYRALEKQLGIGPLPISINEYSGKKTIDDEGKPGASAPIIAKFERFQVDSACISYWDVPHPGRLGSLLASDTARNGGWWFYKWYGDMTGNMVSTTPPSPNDSAALDGFANVDAAAGKASVLFGGVNDGAVQIVIKGIHGVPLFGSTIHAVVEHTPFVNRSTAVNATDTLSTMDLTVANDQVTVSLGNTNGSDGYRLNLSGTGGSGIGGAGSGGSTGSGGAAGGGATAAGGAIVSGSAGTRGDGGGGSLGMGGVTPGAAGATLGAGGATNPVGNAANGGSAGSAGAPSGAGGNAIDATGGGVAAMTSGMDGRNAGCTCGVLRASTGDREWGVIMLVAFATLSRRKRPSMTARDASGA